MKCLLLTLEMVVCHQLQVLRVDYLSHEDSYLPVNSKPELQQWDNYGIYDLICTDSIYSTYSSNVITRVRKRKLQNFLAVQAYSVVPISCDFQAIASTYN